MTAWGPRQAQPELRRAAAGRPRIPLCVDQVAPESQLLQEGAGREACEGGPSIHCLLYNWTGKGRGAARGDLCAVGTRLWGLPLLLISAGLHHQQL